MHNIARIVIDAVIGHDDRVFDYIIPASLHDSVLPGARVFVPFGPREVEGFVLELVDTTDIDESKMKSIIRVPDEFIAIKPEALKIAPIICARFKLRLIDVLRLFVPGSVRGRKRVRVPKNKELKALTKHDTQITLTPAQTDVVNAILGGTGTFVLHGVTGSGKTEVYMHVIQKMLEQNKTAIMLVPEIGLTPQMLGNFRARFGDTVAMVHSGLSPTERYDQWVRLHNGEARIVIGPRSAVFSPVENVGVIIIDEEHDGSYFAESNPRFHTHMVAQIRAQYNKCPVVLGSATPSIETMYRATTGEYGLLKLDRRVHGQDMPRIQIVDMTAELRSGHGGIFSRDLLAALIQTTDTGKQAMVFLNRRGFSSSVMCRGCGWVADCPNCDVSLVWHKEDHMLKCHYCSARFTELTQCKKCGGNQLKYGQIGTQRVVEELRDKFPNIPIFRMDADNTKTKDSLVDILSEFSQTSPSILVGTQMIAKGHDFPHVNVVGIIDADNSLHFSDYRAAERTFALITQVAGRAGRNDTQGDPGVFLQTYKPKHYVYQLAANYDYGRFFEKEVNTREVTKYPPYTTVLRVLVTGEVDSVIKNLLQKIMQQLRTRSNDFIYLGAMKSPLGRIQNKFRYQIMARFTHGISDDMIDFIHTAVHDANPPKSISVFIEINPQNLS